jgi:formylglycine-generating enzyme required for sulfatase activity/serine/threonine protein kinase
MTTAPHDSEPSGQALPTGTRIEEFVIERVLGSGGFGITYLARDTSLNRQVVIKENLPAQFAWRDPASGTVRPRHTTSGDRDDFEWSLTNFLREAETLASLDHPGIVRVLRKFEANGTAYFVMPFVEGVALDELAKSRQETGKAFTEDELRGLLERVLDALIHLHDRGIYHRDIKPGNILITHEGVPVLIDFGSARQRLSERSMTVVESAGYTPFEQLQSRGNVGPWSDLYALGGTIEKSITGETPPKAMDRMRRDPRIPLAQRPDLVAKYSALLLASIDQALSVEEAERWQNAAEWLAALRGVAATAAAPPPVSARTEMPERPPVISSIPGSKINRVPRAIAVGAALGLGVVVLLVMIAFNNTPTSRPVRMAAKQAAEEQRAAELAKAKSTNEEASKVTKAGEERDFEIAPNVKIKMCWIPPGEFMMGSPAGEQGRNYGETQHQVKITQGFWMGKTEVTQGQWRAVMGDNPSCFNGEDLPVEQVSWNDAQGFVKAMNTHAALQNGWEWTLPTEAQWEYACRAGTTGAYAGDLDQMAWYDKNSSGKTHPVGLKKPNAWGLHDMHGNVWEWCADWYGAYPGGAMTDPQGAASGSNRVFRGGGWDYDAYYCRVAGRILYYPSFGGYGIGFRIARSSVPSNSRQRTE